MITNIQPELDRARQHHEMLEGENLRLQARAEELAGELMTLCAGDLYTRDAIRKAIDRLPFKRLAKYHRSRIDALDAGILPPIMGDM